MKSSMIRMGVLLLALQSFAGAGMTTHYVSAASSNPVSPYASWSSAATTIQAAVDAANAGDYIVVSNGTYQTGTRVIHGSLPNRVAVDVPVTVQSVNGPASTIIAGFFISFCAPLI